MTDSTKIVNLADRRPNAAPPVPQHWVQRFGSPNPMSGQERADFTCEAGLHVNAWIAEIHDAGERQIQGVLELKWQQRILERLGYFDETGRPRLEGKLPEEKKDMHVKIIDLDNGRSRMEITLPSRPDPGGQVIIRQSELISSLWGLTFEPLDALEAGLTAFVNGYWPSGENGKPAEELLRNFAEP